MLNVRSGRVALVSLVAVALGTVALAPHTFAAGVVTTDGGSVHMVSHEVDAKVVGRVAEFDVRQTFLASGPRPFEGTYLFPLPDGAIVERFELTLGGQTHAGEVLDRKGARDVYEGIVRQKRDPGLLEFAGQGLARARMFPLEPGKDAAVRVVYRTVLPADAGTIELRYPLATARLSGDVVDRVRISVAVEAERALQVVHCPTHDVRTERDGDRKARVVLERAGAAQDKDFVLWLSSGDEPVGCTVVSAKSEGEDGTFLAVLAPGRPSATAAPVRRDVVFVLDTSGSMEGDKLRQAKAALAYGLRSLAPTDRFGVVTFSTGVRLFRGQLVDAAPEAVRDAVAQIDELSADGGTNIEGALRDGLALLGNAPNASLPFVVFVTDGEPTVGAEDTASLLALASRANARRARLFTFGVGYDVRVPLLDGLAEASGGRREYVAPEENLEVALSRFFRKISTPVLADAVLHMGDDVHDVFPPTVRDLFAGESVVVVGRYARPGDRTIVLRGRGGDAANAERVFEWKVPLRASGGDPSLARVWAQRKVGYLLDQIRLNGRSKELVDEVTRLARRHGLVTPFTSALVVDDADLAAVRARARGGARVADAAVSDHNETDNDLPTDEAVHTTSMGAAPFDGPANNSLIGIGGGAGGGFVGRGGHRNLRVGGGGRRFDDTAEDALRWLAAHQSADGSFDPAGFSRWCDGKSLAAPSMEATGDASRVVGTTGAAVLAFLAQGFTNRSDGPFGRVVANGLRFLRNAQDAEGFFGRRGGAGAAEDHAIATLALVEAFGMTGSTNYKNPAQKGLDALALKDAAIDPSKDAVGASWSLLARHAALMICRCDAAAGKPPSLSVVGGLEDATRRLSAMPAGAISPTAPDAIYLALALRVTTEGRDPRYAPLVVALAESARGRGTAGSAPDLRSGQLLSVLAASVSAGGQPIAWRYVHDVLQLVDGQQHDTDFCVVRGSFAPKAPEAAPWGHVGWTAFAALALSLEHRLPSVSAAAASHPMASVHEPSQLDGLATTGAGSVRDSLDVQRLKEATTADDVRDEPGTLAMVDGKTFQSDDQGRWIDDAWDHKTTPERIESGSAAWIDLAASSPTAARCLALGDHVVVVIGSRVVEVVPANAK